MFVPCRSDASNTGRLPDERRRDGKSDGKASYAGAGSFVRRPLDESWVGRELRVCALRKSPRLRAIDALIDALKRPALARVEDADSAA